MSDLDKMRMDSEEREKKERAALPEAARPDYDDLRTCRREAAHWIARANAAKIALNCFRELRHREPDDSELAKVIDVAMPEFDRCRVEASQKKSSLKESLMSKEAALREKVRAERIAKFEPEHRERAQELYAQMDEELAALKSEISAGDFGRSGGRVFGLERELAKAEKAGDDEEVRHLQSELESARKEKLEAERKMSRHRDNREAVEGKYQQLLVDLEKD